MVCKYVEKPCSSCGKYMCVATHPSKKIGGTELDGKICMDDVPDCLIYEDAIVIEAQWLEEMGVKA